MRARWAACSATLLACAAGAQEAYKFPPPQFSGGYRLPTPTTPGPRPEVFAAIDVGVLILVMSLGAYFVLARRSRREAKLLALFSVAYFGFYRLGCVCSVGSIQNVALALGPNGYALPMSVGAFFVLPLVFALFFGRVFCGTACPLGTIQELVLIRHVRVPDWLEHALQLLPYAILGAGILFAWTGSAFVFCQYDPFVGFYRFSGGWAIIGVGVGLLVLGTFVGRPYCRYLCPYGVLLRWCSAIAKHRVRITPKDCIQCHLCADVCPYGAIEPPAPPGATIPRHEAHAGIRRNLLALPVLALVFAWLGHWAAPTFSRIHPAVVQADQVWSEEKGVAKAPTDASTAFYRTGRPNAELYARAAEIRRRFDLGSPLLGAWIGIVVGARTLALRRRSRSKDYVADPAACLSCARCYASCPVEQERLGLIAPLIRPADIVRQETPS